MKPLHWEISCAKENYSTLTPHLDHHRITFSVNHSCFPLSHFPCCTLVLVLWFILHTIDLCQECLTEMTTFSHLKWMYFSFERLVSLTSMVVCVMSILGLTKYLFKVNYYLIYIYSYMCSGSVQYRYTHKTIYPNYFSYQFKGLYSKFIHSHKLEVN